MSRTIVDQLNPPKFENFIGENYEIALKQAIHALSDSLPSRNSQTSSDLADKFRELLQCRTDPPLETIWAYSALIFFNYQSTKDDPSSQLSAVKDLFQLIVSCSASSSSMKSIILVGPVVYTLYNFIIELEKYQLPSKKVQKFEREIYSFVNSLIGYVSVGGPDSGGDDLGVLVTPLENLVKIWVSDKVIENGGGGEALKVFFPLLTDGMIRMANLGEYGMNRLAGFIIAEVFLFKLCLWFRVSGSRTGLLNELKSWTVGSITGIANSYFYETLAFMLLDPSLPVATLMKSEDEVSLKKMLYDTVSLVDYAFLHSERLGHQPAEHVKGVTFVRLLVTHQATELYREQGDHAKVISFTSAFTSSDLPSQITKLIRNEIGTELEIPGPTGTSPGAILRWIRDLENLGLRILGDDLSKHLAELLLDSAREDVSAYMDHGKRSDTDLLFYIDNKGDEEGTSEEDQSMTESMNNAFMVAAHSMHSEDHGGRKRKAKARAKKNRVKLPKYTIYGNSSSPREQPMSSDSEASRSKSEVENPSSDSDSEVMDQ